MKRAIVVVAVASFLMPAFAGNEHAPELTFRTIPIEESLGPKEHKVTPYRINDTMIVTVKDPVACGQKPVKPSMAIKEGKLFLGYDLTPAAPGAAACTLVSEFSVAHLPQQSLEVHFAGGPEPYTVARLSLPTTGAPDLR